MKIIPYLAFSLCAILMLFGLALLGGDFPFIVRLPLSALCLVAGWYLGKICFELLREE